MENKCVFKMLLKTGVQPFLCVILFSLLSNDQVGNLIFCTCGAFLQWNDKCKKLSTVMTCKVENHPTPTFIDTLWVQDWNALFLAAFYISLPSSSAEAAITKLPLMLPSQTVSCEMILRFELIKKKNLILNHSVHTAFPVCFESNVWDRIGEN